MDERDSHCPYPPSSETTAKGTGLEESAGKEDPVELRLESGIVGRVGRCRISGSFGASEIPLLLISSYLLRQTGGNGDILIFLLFFLC